MRAYLRSFVHPFRSYSLDGSIFFSNFLHEVVSPYDLDDHKKYFRSKIFLNLKSQFFSKKTIRNVSIQNISKIQRAVWEIEAKMLILGQKEANLDQKGPKMGGARFFQTVNISFPKEDHKISFYTKNQQNSTNHLEDIS